MAKIFVTRKTSNVCVDILKKWSSNVEIWDQDCIVPYDVLSEKAKHVDALVSHPVDKIDENILKNPNLKIVAQSAVGIDNIDLNIATRYNVIISHTPGVLTETCADFAWALMLASARRVCECSEYVKAGKWVRHEPNIFIGLDVHGKTLGVIGPGRIGEGVIKRAYGFSMKVLYHEPHRKQHIDELGASYVPLDNLLSQSDFVVLCCPLTPETKHLIDIKKLKMMKSTAVLVNIARGAVVVTDDLVEALKTGVISYAALDVTDPEPIPNNHPLVSLPNCLIASHIAYSTQATKDAVGTLTAESVIDCLEGRPVKFQANKDAVPKKL